MSDTSRAPRDNPLDFLKGVLVIVMVLYHAMNVYADAGPGAYSYIRFVSGSFVFVSGYFLPAFYGERFSQAPWGTSKRLLQRGFKLVLLFTLLNGLILLSGVGNPHKQTTIAGDYWAHAAAIYGIGAPGAAAFQILLPIAYVLLLAPLFLGLSKYRHGLIAGGFASALAWSLADIESINLGMGVVGIIGLFLGMAASSLERLFGIPGKTALLAGIAATMALMEFFDRNALTYAVGVTLMVMLLYALARRLALQDRASAVAILLGKYSLLGYIGQIVLLQVSARLLGGPRWPLGVEILAIVAATTVLLALLCYALQYLRGRSTLVDKGYRLVFS
jgi:peptidoglycan/LPS O-acetylase OafA/YrhL